MANNQELSDRIARIEQILDDLKDRLDTVETGLADLSLTADAPDISPFDSVPQAALAALPEILTDSVAAAPAALLGPSALLALGDILSGPGQSPKSIVVAEGAVDTDDCASGQATIRLPAKVNSAKFALQVEVRGTAKTHCSVDINGAGFVNPVAPGSKSPIIAVPLGTRTIAIACSGGNKSCDFSYKLAQVRTNRYVNRVRIRGLLVNVGGKIDEKCKTGKTTVTLKPALGAGGLPFYTVRLNVLKASKCSVEATYDGASLVTVSPGGSGTAVFQGIGGRNVIFQCKGANATDPCKANYSIVVP